MIEIDEKWDRNKRRKETSLLRDLIRTAALTDGARTKIEEQAAKLVQDIRHSAKPAMMELFLSEYGLSTDEGVALMCLAEALLRVPDAATIDKLIKDKIAPSDWSSHLGHSSSPLINASTWGLFLTGRVLDHSQTKVLGTLRAMITRMGEPVIRKAVSTAMRELGRQFVLGQDIDAALARAAKNEAKGYSYSYDMLGEAALTARDAARYAQAYRDAISSIARVCRPGSVTNNPGISIKLSALHPRYEVAQTNRVLNELVPIVTDLARRAKAAHMGLNIDAEEADRLGLSMEVIARVLADPDLRGWDGFGVVVQAYGRRAIDVIDALHALAEQYGQRVMVRLVKGAYWDTEIKHAQVEGLHDFPVFTQKSATDTSYIACARRLLQYSKRIYPQFATHNAHTVVAVLQMAQEEGVKDFEFQRLHGMGEALHQKVLDQYQTNCRIYAPVGPYRDLLAYLVRRLLENGANSSFVNQIVDHDVCVARIVACPLRKVEARLTNWPKSVAKGNALFGPERRNSKGFDVQDVTVLNAIAVRPQTEEAHKAKSIMATIPSGEECEDILNPATEEVIGLQVAACQADIEAAFAAAQPWDQTALLRSEVLCLAADLYEENAAEIFAILTQEAGKTLADAVAELREAVDFLRYYALQARDAAVQAPRGLITAISPWNFPLAIFTGQIAAALATGNAVIAKPAETTPLIACFAVKLLHKAGVPPSALQLLLGDGRQVGLPLCSDPRVNAVVFTGSTKTARVIQSAMAKHCYPGTPLIAETGGLNAMIVDSTALPEQAIGDIIASAFQSAGQRCSALRCLYVQNDVMPQMLEMLKGAMDELQMGDPVALSTDVGPVISAQARDHIRAYIEKAEFEGRVLHQLKTPNLGFFIPPTLVHVRSIRDLTQEVFGPVLHICGYEAHALDKVIQDINNTGYGLTFGLHTRIDERVQSVCDQVNCGNLYVNRNQIGAIVGSQPFGGEGLSGTGPKAGGPFYLSRFQSRPKPAVALQKAQVVDRAAIQEAIFAQRPRCANISTTLLPGPTGELNALSLRSRLPILCLGPGKAASKMQCRMIEELGGCAVSVPGELPPDALLHLQKFGGVLWWGDTASGREYASALAQREGPIIPLLTESPDQGHALYERHLCVDTTAAGGNADLLAAQA